MRSLPSSSLSPLPPPPLYSNMARTKSSHASATNRPSKKSSAGGKQKASQGPASTAIFPASATVVCSANALHDVKDGRCVAQAVTSLLLLLRGEKPSYNNATYDAATAGTITELDDVALTIPTTQALSPGDGCYHISVVQKYIIKQGFDFHKVPQQGEQARKLLLDLAAGRKKDPTRTVYFVIGHINARWFPEAAKEEGFNPWHVSVFDPTWKGPLTGNAAGCFAELKKKRKVFAGRVFCGLWEDVARPLVFGEALTNANGLGQYKKHLKCYKVSVKK